MIILIKCFVNSSERSSDSVWRSKKSLLTPYCCISTCEVKRNASEAKNLGAWMFKAARALAAEECVVTLRLLAKKNKTKKQLVLKKQKEKKLFFKSPREGWRNFLQQCNNKHTHTHMHVRMKKRVEKVWVSVGWEGFLRDGNNQEEEKKPWRKRNVEFWDRWRGELWTVFIWLLKLEDDDDDSWEQMLFFCGSFGIFQTPQDSTVASLWQCGVSGSPPSVNLSLK